MIPEKCPFCKQPATYTLIASADYELICPTCVIRVEITQVAAAMECPHPEIVLQYIREQTYTGRAHEAFNLRRHAQRGSEG